MDGQNLCETTKESNILRDFSLHVRKVLVKEVVTFLLEGNNAQKTLLSPAHVTWAMETVGQGFALPIEEEDSIVKVITLYRVWCLDGKRPAPFEENPQHFTRVCSIIFFFFFFLPNDLTFLLLSCVLFCCLNGASFLVCLSCVCVVDCE